MRIVQLSDSPRTTDLPEAVSLDRLVEAFADVGPEEILRVYQPNCCILASRVAIEVFRHFGVNARPLVVKMDVANPASYSVFTRARREGWSDAEFRRRMVIEGAYSIGIGYPTGGPGYDGHVVVILEDRQLLDASIVQVHKPSRGIHFPLVALLRPLSPEFLAGVEPTGAILPTGTVLCYQRILSPPEFRHSRDWTDERRWGSIVRRIVHRMTDLLS